MRYHVKNNSFISIYSTENNNNNNEKNNWREVCNVFRRQIFIIAQHSSCAYCNMVNMGRTICLAFCHISYDLNKAQCVLLGLLYLFPYNWLTHPHKYTYCMQIVPEKDHVFVCGLYAAYLQSAYNVECNAATHTPSNIFEWFFTFPSKCYVSRIIFAQALFVVAVVPIHYANSN